jgi:uncharacterized protein YbjT (DUF2867 family)
MTKHRVVVLGGTGVAGRAIVEALSDAGHDVVSASRSGGVDVATGVGLADAFAGATTVVDAANAAKDAEAVLVTGTGNAVLAARAAGVAHYVVIGIVGADRVPLGYYRLKLRQEAIVRDGGVPHTVLRATQFHPFVRDLVRSTGRLGVLPAPRARFQPLDPRDLARAVAGAVADGPGPDRAIAGPEVLTLREIAEQTGAGRRLRIPVPGRLARAVVAGGLTDEAAPRGRVTFAEWLRS